MKEKLIYFALAIAVAVLISVDASNNARRRSARRLFREKAMFMQFFNSTGEILKKKNETDWTVDDWLYYFQKDLRNAFAVGTIYLRLMNHYNSLNTTKLTPEENTAIQNYFKTLVKDYRNHDSYALWMGEEQGGTITAAIFKYVGGDPVSVIGPPNNPEDVMSEIVYPTEKPDTR